MLGIVGRAWAKRQTQQRPANRTALGTAAKSHSAFFPTEQSNADKRRLDRERCLNHPVASLGESWNRDPEALSWRLHSLPLGISVRDSALMKDDVNI